MAKDQRRRKRWQAVVSSTSIAFSRLLLFFLDKNLLIPTPFCANIHFKEAMLGPPCTCFSDCFLALVNKKQGKNEGLPFGFTLFYQVHIQWLKGYPRAFVSNILSLFYKASSHTLAHLNLTGIHRKCKNKYFLGMKFSH